MHKITLGKYANGSLVQGIYTVGHFIRVNINWVDLPLVSLPWVSLPR